MGAGESLALNAEAVVDCISVCIASSLATVMFAASGVRIGLLPSPDAHSQPPNSYIMSILEACILFTV